ncbi:hypothetical protein [Chryseobacterium sp. CH21]|nr:hypothetical protein [Chryseobacterium sp. CH21]
MLNVLLPHETKMNECRDITKQILALAAQTSKILAGKISDDRSFNA